MRDKVMSSNSENNKRIAKNTLVLYVRMFFTMVVGLYTSRVVLNTLGVEDYGIYNVVGGVVAMFSLISGSLSGAISRFLTFELGRNNQRRLKTIFSSAVTIQITLAILIGVLAEIGGVWFLNNKMNIPTERLAAANWVLQCSILAFMINLVSVPYNAAIIAHERMKAFAYFGILEVVLKLGAVLLLYIALFDKLVTYAVLLLTIAVLIRLTYGMYCKRHFPECTYHFVYDKSLLKEMGGFAGWNFIGTAAAILRDQGVNIAINLFCGTAVNAARGISFQVSSVIHSFVSNFMTALNPQITKSYATGNREYMFTLLFQGARFSYYMLLLLSLPVIIEANIILTIWLKIVPEHTVNFVQLVLVLAMFDSISAPLVTAMLAAGKIRNYQIVVGGLNLVNFPLSYLLLRWGFFPEITMIIAIFLSQCCLAARLWFLRGLIGLSAVEYIKHVYLNVLLVSLFSALPPILLYLQMSAGVERFISVTICSIVTTFAVILYIGCSKPERIFIVQKIVSMKSKSLKR